MGKIIHWENIILKLTAVLYINLNAKIKIKFSCSVCLLLNVCFDSLIVQCHVLVLQGNSRYLIYFASGYLTPYHLFLSIPRDSKFLTIIFSFYQKKNMAEASRSTTSNAFDTQLNQNAIEDNSSDAGMNKYTLLCALLASTSSILLGYG